MVNVSLNISKTSNHDMTFVLTSCGRPDLLDRVLNSFFKYNTYPIKDYIIVEDSIDQEIYQRLKKDWGHRINFIFNKKKKGQIKSIIDTYKLVTTPYIFHCEDDWVYTRGNFIQESLEILKSDKFIIQVWLESKESASRLDIFSYLEQREINNIKFSKVICKEGWEWGHFSFRPGVKRLDDYQRINGYEKYKNELDISVRYKSEGFYTVIVDDPAVIDIGSDLHVSDPTRRWPKRRKVNAPVGLKRLWKHIKNFKFL